MDNQKPINVVSLYNLFAAFCGESGIETFIEAVAAKGEKSERLKIIGQNMDNEQQKWIKDYLESEGAKVQFLSTGKAFEYEIKVVDFYGVNLFRNLKF